MPISNHMHNPMQQTYMSFLPLVSIQSGLTLTVRAFRVLCGWAMAGKVSAGGCKDGSVCTCKDADLSLA